jgi:Kef-type K+ transport system membrane component KefB
MLFLVSFGFNSALLNMALFQNPITNPVAIFTLIISIILFVPSLSKKINIPSIFGLILAGVIIGPNGTGMLQSSEGISIFASVGLLYIMFLAGLEINISTFRQNRNKSIVFGLATFILPMGIGFPILFYLLNYPVLPALLISSMFSTHTLLSYPIASKLNIIRRESVVVTIGGTILTDTAVLILLSVITTAYAGKLDGNFWIQLLVLLLLFVFTVLWGLPKIARWYFTTFQSDSNSQYVFVLASLFISALLAKYAGIEPIVGAFLSGLALNQVIPHHSPLMNRTVFIGNSIFIPFFLISVGMLVNLNILFAGLDTLFLASVLTGIAIAGKYLAAWFTQLYFKYSKADGRLIFGLSASHAAATIAVITVGFQMHILDEKVLNGTILLILVTCLVSTFVTERAGRIIAIEENDPANKYEQGPDRILIPVANPVSFEKLFEIALLTKLSDADTVIYPLFIITDDEDFKESISHYKDKLNQLVQHAAATDITVSPITRVDINIPTGISRSVKEISATKIVLGWSSRSATLNYFFGNIIDNLLETTQQMLMVVRTSKPLNYLNKIYVLVPANADREVGFYAWVNAVISISKKTRGKIVFLSNQTTTEILKRRLKEFKIFDTSNFAVFEYYPNISAIPAEVTENDLTIAIVGRPSTISYSRRQLVLPKLISHQPESLNYIVLYPEQVEIPSITVTEITVDAI